MAEQWGRKKGSTAEQSLKNGSQFLRSVHFTLRPDCTENDSLLQGHPSQMQKKVLNFDSEITLDHLN